MKLFRISQDIHNGWDTYSDAVVVAPNEVVAKNIHPDSYKGCDPWPRDIWADTPDQVEAEYIGEAAEHLSQGAVICASFHAG